MKKIVLSIVLLLSISLAKSQYYYIPYGNGMNPGNLNTDDEFPVGGGLTTGWTSILSGGKTTPAFSSSQTIPFTFNFDGGAVTKYKVSSSGVLTFSNATTAPAYSSVALPSSTIPDSSVCILGLKGTGSNDNIVTKNFGTAPNRQHWIFFSSYTGLTASYTYWSIVLEETTNKIYIVEQRHSGPFSDMSLGIQLNSTTAYSVSGSPTVGNKAFGSASPIDNYIYEFNFGTRPKEDIAVLGLTNNENQMKNSSVSIKGVAFNRGDDTIKSFDINYQVGSGSVVTSNVSSMNIAPDSVFQFTHPTNWTTPSTAGTVNVKAWTSNINSKADVNPFDDSTSKMFTILDTFVVRKSLLEVFTSSTCGPCVAGNQNMDNVVLPTINNYTVIKYQQNFPGSGDPYFTTTSVNRRSFYNITSIPRMEIDGAWDQNAASFTSSEFDRFQSIPSIVSIKINNARHTGKTVKVDATISPLDNLTGNLKYHLVVTEKKTTGNTGTNGETEFFHVMMDMIPTLNGTSLTSLNKGTPTNIVKSADLNSSNIEEDTDLKIVVFVQDMTTGEVYQSEWADITASPSGINENSNDISIDVYPNPSNGQITLNYSLNNNTATQINVVDVVGKTVFSKTGKNSKGNHQETLDLSQLKKGVYFVKINTTNGIVTKKIILK